MISSLPNGIEIFRDSTGVHRLLTHRVCSGEAGYMALPSFQDAYPLVPEAKWREIDNRSLFPFILDQNGHGSCTDHAATYVQRKTRIAQGMDDVDLSATWGYSLVNGNRDQGAMVSDLLPVMRAVGRCLMSQFPEELIYQKQLSAAKLAECRKTALRFRVTEAWALTSRLGDDPFHVIMSALQLGFYPAFAIQVGNNFDRLDSDGACGYTRGPGNHAVHADGCKKGSNGRWLLDMPNSWGKTWANQGRAFLTANHVNLAAQDGYILRVATDDPESDNPPPVR